MCCTLVLKCASFDRNHSNSWKNNEVQPFPQPEAAYRLRGCKFSCYNIYSIMQKEHNIGILPMVIRINMKNQIRCLTCVWMVGIEMSKPSMSSSNMLNANFLI